MTWVTAVLISTTLFAVVTVMDKRLATNLYPSAGAFNVGFGVMQVCICVIYFAAVIPTVGFDGGSGIPWAMASGLLWGLGLFLFFHALRIEEVSRAVPVQQLAPVFAAVVAVLFLGELLTPLQWAAVLVVIAGAVLVSARPEQGLFRIARGRAFFLLLGGSFSLGMAFVASEQATREMNVWGIQAWRSLAMSGCIFLLAARPATVREFTRASRRFYTLFTLVLAEGLLAPLAALTFVIALDLGQVSSVSAVSASRPLITLILGAALSTRLWNVLNEPLDKETLGLKTLAVVMIVGGVAALTLG